MDAIAPNNNNNNNKPAAAADDHTEVPATIYKPSYTNEDMINVHQALTGKYITGTATIFTLFPLPYQQASAIGCLACLLAGVDHKKCLMTPNLYHKHLTRMQPNALPGTPSIGYPHMPMFNDFLQEWLMSNQLEGRAGTKFSYPYNTQTVVDLTHEQDNFHVFASLEADIVKKQDELKAAIARLTAFTGTLVNSDVPMVVPIAASDPIFPAAVSMAAIAAIGNVVARKSKRVCVQKKRMNL